MTASIRILLVDDHLFLRIGVRSLLATYSDIEVVGEASNGNEAISLTARLEPDVILMDLVMSGMGGTEAISQIVSHHPAVRILVLTSFLDDEKVFASIKAGALGYILKDSSADELVDAIREVYHGRPALAPNIALKLMQELKENPSHSVEQNKLTTRESEVLNLLAQGFSNQQIGKALFITERTVSAHINKILKKLHVANRTQAALLARQQFSVQKHF